MVVEDVAGDRDRPVKFFGSDGTMRGVLMSRGNHAHETSDLRDR
jgi:hypothetical protein